MVFELVHGLMKFWTYGTFELDGSSMLKQHMALQNLTNSEFSCCKECVPVKLTQL